MSISNAWLMSKAQYFVDFFTIPLMIVAALYFGTFVFWLFLLGVLTWSFIEYTVHRFVFHRYFRSEHWLHHKDVEEYIGIQSWKVGLTYATLGTIAVLCNAASLFVGFAFGYFCYISMHYYMHRPHTLPAKYLKIVRINHDLHHVAGIEKNFGVTSPLWDYIFRTKV
jgi:dihydroceramide fatty acyl 2-hydroxylase